jgi:hypothetical protein
MLLFCGEQKYEMDTRLVEWLLLLQDINGLKRALYQQQILIHDHYAMEFKMS